MNDDILKRIHRLANPPFLKHVQRLEKTLSVGPNQSAIDKAMTSSVTLQSAIDKTVEPFAVQHSAIDRYIEDLIRPSTLEKTIASCATQHSAIYGYMEDLIRHSTLEKTIASFATQYSSIEKRIESFTYKQSAIDKIISSFATWSSLLIDEPNYLSELACTISSADISKLDDSSFEEELNQSCNLLNKGDDGKSSVNVFKALPDLIQYIVLCFLLHFILPHVSSISANLLTPVVGNYLGFNNASDRDKIKIIKKIPLSLEGVYTGGLRFITGNNVRLRMKPSTNSEIIDELVFGQVVTVLYKNKNWTKIMYKYENEESISGWVFTRYTAKFVRQN